MGRRTKSALPLLAAVSMLSGFVLFRSALKGLAVARAGDGR
jgi:hypothetical protein